MVLGGCVVWQLGSWYSYLHTHWPVNDGVETTMIPWLNQLLYQTYMAFIPVQYWLHWLLMWRVLQFCLLSVMLSTTVSLWKIPQCSFSLWEQYFQMDALNHSFKGFLFLTYAQHGGKTKVIWVDDGPFFRVLALCWGWWSITTFTWVLWV